jgi:hypothetical protein
MATQGYDPNKAALFNQLRQQGLSEDAAAAQAGISDAPSGTYIIGDNGQLGAPIGFGAGKVAGVDFVRPTAAQTAESDRFDQGLQSSSNFEQVDYAVKAKNPPSLVTPINYVTTSTENVSGGGSTETIAGPRTPTRESQTYAAEAAAKQAEINQFNKDNPSDYIRKRQGLPPLTSEENEARSAKLGTLQNQYNTISDKKSSAETPGTPTVITTPNTTTTTQTVTSGTAAVNTPVSAPAGDDPTVNQQTEIQISTTASVANNNTSFAPAPATSYYENDGTASSDQVVTFAPASVSGDEAIDAANEAELAQLREAEGAAIFAPAPASASGDEALDAANEAELAQLREAEGRAIFGPAPVATTGDEALAATEAAEAARAANLDPYDFAASADAGRQSQLRDQFTLQQRFNTSSQGDWRVRLRLAPGAKYLYRAEDPGILQPLVPTDGIIFPYTPTISTQYSAKYDSYNLTHSNYRGYFYQSSQVGDITVTGTFTAQDTAEAEYLLAVIHFFRSVTKMFYGKDPQRGSPPPLVELSGFGEYQFNNHPCLVASFNYTLPNNVDYIQVKPNNQGLNMSERTPKVSSSPASTIESVLRRLTTSHLPKGAQGTPVDLGAVRNAVNGLGQTTYVPTKIEISVVLHPLQTRQQVSQGFSLENFAKGNLLKGGFW